MSSKPISADDQFYREYIIDHYKNPRNFGRLERPDISHEEDNPLCGDVVGMDFQVKDGVIEDIRFHGRGCAISQASASLLTERLKGMTLDDAKKFNDGTIFVCQVGERSAVASEMAVALGVKDVVNFRGGTKAWKDAGLPLETP